MLIAGVGILSTPSSLHGITDPSTETTALRSIGQSSTSLGGPPIQATSTRSREGGSSNVLRVVHVSQASSVAAKPDSHMHWCWVCGKQENLTTCGGFERHVKEHYDRFLCISLDLYTKSPNTCAICGVYDTSPEHLSQHNALPCMGKSFSRASNLREHLDKEHGANDYSKLVQFSKGTAQKYFACGFCVFVSISGSKQIRHIHAHYKKSKQVRDWDPNKVILGLLSLNKDWQNFRAAYQYQDSLFSWNDTGLQERLEMSQESADVLYEAAIISLRYPVIDVSRLVQRPPNPYSRSPLPSYGGQTFNSHDLWTSPPILPSQASDAIHEDGPLPPTTSETHLSPTSATYYESHQRPQPVRSLTSDEGYLGRGYPGHQPRITTASEPSPVMEGYPGVLRSPRFGGPSQMGSTNAVPSPRPQHTTDSYYYASQAPIAGMNRLPTTQSLSSPFSPSLLPGQDAIFNVDYNYNQDQVDMRRRGTHY